MPLSAVTPVKVGNTPVALTTCSGLAFAPSAKVDIPASAANAKTFPQASTGYFIVYNSTGSAVTLTAALDKTSQQTAAGVVVDDKTYSIAQHCICLVKTFEAVAKGGQVQLHASATGLQLFAFN